MSPDALHFTLADVGAKTPEAKNAEKLHVGSGDLDRPSN